MLKEFLEALETEVVNHSIYVWGAQGQGVTVIDEAWIKYREKNKSSNYNRAIDYWIKQVKLGFAIKIKAFDCSGLGIYILMKLGLIKYDMSANGLMGKCERLSKSELRKGDWVFKTYRYGTKKGKAYHIGYVVDDALNVIEAGGRDLGVCKRPLSKNSWRVFGRPKYFAQEIAAQAVDVITIAGSGAFNRVLKLKDPYMRGEDIRTLQKALGGLKEDGVFGRLTEAAVKAYQQKNGLVVDGKAGRNTITKLGFKWEV